jgi:ABC-type lipoprotein release transport system permease subunit
VLAAVGDRDLVVLDWRDQNRDLFAAMFLEKVAMFIALVFVILVAAFGILATNLMGVLEKAPEIAILKTMGCPDRVIARIFALEGLCVGLLGSFGGIAAGVGLGLALGATGSRSAAASSTWSACRSASIPARSRSSPDSAS